MGSKKNERDTFKYQYLDNQGRIQHSGITNDLDRREGEHRRQYGPGRIRQVGRRTTRDAAKDWGGRQTVGWPLGPLAGSKVGSSNRCQNG